MVADFTALPAALWLISGERPAPGTEGRPGSASSAPPTPGGS
jgi:hypothetical protein